MSNEEWNSVDPARSKLRAFAARVEHEIVQLGADVGGTPHSARVSAVTLAWREFAGILALGEEPALRACPHCRRKVLREATRCRYCMRSSAAEKRAEWRTPAEVELAAERLEPLSADVTRSMKNVELSKDWMKHEPFMMRRILCALDVERSGSTSLSMASLLAEHFHASVDALYATPAVPMYDSPHTHVERLESEHNAHERLTGMLAAIKRKVALSSFVTRGDATEVILTHSERQGSDLIVMASSPNRRFDARVGTIAPVTALAPCAVLTVGDRFQPAAPRRILLPIGPAGAGRDALSWASALASRFDAEVGVLRVGERRSGVWRVFSATLDRPTHFDGAGVLAALCSRGIDAYEIEHPGGDDCDAVSDLCESGGFDAVVMGVPAAGESHDGDVDVSSVRLKTNALVLSVRSIRSTMLFAPSHLQPLPKAVASTHWAQS